MNDKTTVTAISQSIYQCTGDKDRLTAGTGDAHITSTFFFQVVQL